MMSKTGLLKILVVAAVAFAYCKSAGAQYFGTAPSAPSRKTTETISASVEPKAQQTAPVKANEKYSVVDTTEAEMEKEIKSQPVSSPFDYAYGKQQPKKQAPVQSYRRYSTVGGVTVETTEENQEDELIMLYMKNFSIYRSPSGRTRCSARFAVLTTLPTRLANISYRLKWPKMETTLAFNDVDPGVENHFDYALLGDGCYSMDKQPNIVVNRCRAKGMTQRQCAAKIRWIKEM